MRFKTSIPDQPTLGVTAVSGATRPAGKTDGPEAVLLGNDPGTRPAVAVKQAEEVKGCARKCIDAQVQGDGGSNSPNGNPKRRSKSSWGVSEPCPGE